MTPESGPELEKKPVRKFCFWVTYPPNTRIGRIRTRLAKWIAPWLREPPKVRWSEMPQVWIEDRAHIGGGAGGAK